MTRELVLFHGNCAESLLHHRDRRRRRPLKRRASLPGGAGGMVTMQREAHRPHVVQPGIGGLAKGISSRRSTRSRIDGGGHRPSRHSVQGPEPPRGPRYRGLVLSAIGLIRPRFAIFSRPAEPDDRGRSVKALLHAAERSRRPSRRRLRSPCSRGGHHDGTFLRALMHSGEVKTVGGRFGEASAEWLSDSLRQLGLNLGRLKTGTPPRIEKASVDFSILEEAPGDAIPRPFSILTDRLPLPQVLCHLTHTSSRAHELIRANLHRAPMYSGQIKATGPRYCLIEERSPLRGKGTSSDLRRAAATASWLYMTAFRRLYRRCEDGVVHTLPDARTPHCPFGMLGVDFGNPDNG